MLGELGVAEDALDGALGVIEVAAHPADSDVAALLRTHLELLHAGDLALWIEDGDAHTGRIGKAGKRRLSGVTRGRGDDLDLGGRILGGRFGRAGHETREHLQGNVLERARGAMPQLEDVGGHAIGVRGLREWHHGGDFIAGKGALVCLGDAGGDLVGAVVGQ